MAEAAQTAAQAAAAAAPALALPATGSPEEGMGEQDTEREEPQPHAAAADGMQCLREDMVAAAMTAEDAAGPSMMPSHQVCLAVACMQLQLSQD